MRAMRQVPARCRYTAYRDGYGRELSPGHDITVNVRVSSAPVARRLLRHGYTQAIACTAGHVHRDRPRRLATSFQLPAMISSRNQQRCRNAVPPAAAAPGRLAAYCWGVTVHGKCNDSYRNLIGNRAAHCAAIISPVVGRSRCPQFSRGAQFVEVADSWPGEALPAISRPGIDAICHRRVPRRYRRWLCSAKSRTPGCHQSRTSAPLRRVDFPRSRSPPAAPLQSIFVGGRVRSFPAMAVESVEARRPSRQENSPATTVVHGVLRHRNVIAAISIQYLHHAPLALTVYRRGRHLRMAPSASDRPAQK